MREQERHRLRPFALFVNEMQIDAAKRHLELAQAIDRGLVLSPIEIAPPIVDQALHIVDARAGRPWFEWRFVGPARAGEAIAQVIEDGIRNRKLERARLNGCLAHGRVSGGMVKRDAGPPGIILGGDA